MTTINQIIRKKRIKTIKKVRLRELSGCPQKKGICTAVLIRTPRKPNSAKRKVAKVKLTNKFEINVYISGEGHNLQQHSTVLVHGGGPKDLPGVSYRAIRGKYDLEGVSKRRRSRSRYGTKKYNNTTGI